jgi:hypothetical protein
LNPPSTFQILSTAQHTIAGFRALIDDGQRQVDALVHQRNILSTRLEAEKTRLDDAEPVPSLLDCQPVGAAGQRMEKEKHQYDLIIQRARPMGLLIISFPDKFSKLRSRLLSAIAEGNDENCLGIMAEMLELHVSGRGRLHLQMDQRHYFRPITSFSTPNSTT